MIRAGIILMMLLLSSCDRNDAPVSPAAPVTPKDSVITTAFPPKFVSVNYIELDKIERISKFRSGIGHDYRDDAESCRSMKHYYQPLSNVNWGSVKIFSPVTGTVSRTIEEWAGTQVWITPKDYPAFTFIIFHIAGLKPFAVGDTMIAGAQIGTHIGSQTMSDIAVAYSAGGKWKLISFAEVMTDSLFARYQARGVAARDSLIISKTARDADPLGCSGDTFGSSGTLPNWVVLK